MKKKKFKTVQDIVNGQDFVVVAVVAFCLEKLYNKQLLRHRDYKKNNC